MVFAAIVLLQADIRRALVHLGRGTLFRRLRAQDQRRRHGRGAGGGGHDAGGEEDRRDHRRSSDRSACATTSRAASRSTRKLTYDLLVSIFQPTSPLHDGAVIVQGDRVAAAACFLPLTVNPRLSRELGSRHRAAIGVTEENDAVAIVVSEETGRISLVEDGDLEHDIDAERLRARLQSVVTLRRGQRQAAAGRVLVRLMAYHPFRNLGLKFLSMLVASAAVAGRRRRAGRRARDARAGRVPEPARRASKSSAIRRTRSKYGCADRPAR